MEIHSIMIVDDSEGDHLITEITIKDYDDNIKIYKAYDGAEALALLDKLDEQPSVILLDINMPLMGGFEFLEQYQQINSPNVIVMLSSSEQTQDKDKAFSYDQVKGYIVKPLEVSNLEEIANL